VKPKFPRVPVMSVLSLLLLVALIVIWVRSRRHADMLCFFTPAGHLQAVATDRTGLVLFFSDVPFGQEMGLTADALSSSRDEFSEVRDFVFDPTAPSHHFLGFRIATGKMQWSWKYTSMIVPYWALLVVLAIGPLAMFRCLWTRIGRQRRGQCLACGYDLRHSTGRCPECGEEISANRRGRPAAAGLPATEPPAEA
jgi:predicted RNA-binding Zn-ribbon protein involved in translation (DUF1610 family)